MIRGNIEVVTPELIQGWIYTEDGNIRNRVLLAFQNNTCVGSGRVEVFRPDLADAGLGDGHLGFSFPISVAPEATGSVVLKLEGSDAALLQPTAVISTGDAPVATTLDRAGLRGRLASLKWALKNGRISQADFDYLRILWSFGIYERGLIRRIVGDDNTVTDKAEAVAAGLLEAYVETDVELVTKTVRNPAQFAEEIAAIARDPGRIAVVALHTGDRATLRALETSHLEGNGNGEDDNGSLHFVDYALSPENLIVLDTRTVTELTLAERGTLQIISGRPLA